MSKELLVVFTKNPVPGKVKLRLAATIGEERALKVYQKLLKRTREAVLPLSQTVLISYSDFPDYEDLWENEKFLKSLQEGHDLGERMYNAIQLGFEKGYEKVCLIGTDIPALDSNIIAGAFRQLQKKRAVIGPALDGGYYLIGFSHLSTGIKNIFSNKAWSTDTVYRETIRSFEIEKFTYAVLPTLADLDVESDLPPDFPG